MDQTKKAAALKSLKRYSEKPEERPADLVVEKITDDVDPSTVLCTTYIMRDFYTQMGAGYFHDLEIMNYITHHANALMLKKNMKMLDICCGRGAQLPLLRWYRKDIARYVGVDISTRNLNQATRKSASKRFEPGVRLASNYPGSQEPYYPFEVHLFEYNVAKLDEHPEISSLGPYDHAMYKGIEHMQKDAGIQSLYAARKLMTPGATLFITSPNTEHKKDEYDTQYAAHLYEWGRDELQQQLLECGFRVEHQYGMLARKRKYMESLQKHHPELVPVFQSFAEYLPKDWLMAIFPIITPDIADEVVFIATAY